MHKHIPTTLAIALLFSVTSAHAIAPVAAENTTSPNKLQQDGNYREAYTIYEKQCLSPDQSGHQTGQSLRNAIQCLQRLNESQKIDSILERTIAAHPNDWRLLSDAATEYHTRIPHNGYIIAGKFSRGHHRGGGKAVNSNQRDRIRALQLLQKARKLALPSISSTTDTSISNTAKSSAFSVQRSAFSHLCLQFATTLSQNHRQSWQLQYLTDITTLPDYANGYYQSNDSRNAPVDAAGQPVFHNLPKTYETARTDGERWRSLLAEAAHHNPQQQNHVQQIMADFAYNQFGVQTMRQYNWFFRSTPTDGKTRDAAFTLDTLTEDETMAKLATGIKRFSLPKEWNYIAIYRDLPNENAINNLATIFENRRQYNKAVTCWKQSIEKHGDSKTHRKQKSIDQITKNWGQFESVSTHPAGTKATIEFKFRNGDQVQFEAHAIKTEQLLNDVKAYLSENPRKIKHQKINIRNIGYRLIHEDGSKYTGKQVANWTEKLTPSKNHFDSRTTITTPLTKAGAYLLTAKMANGNTSTVVIWITDTVIAHKRLDGQPYYFVADAITGKPIPNASVEFFGYRQEYIQNPSRLPGARRYNILTKNFTQKSNANGEVIPNILKNSKTYQWLITATKDQQTSNQRPADQQTSNQQTRDQQTRFAFLGFTHIWTNTRHDREYKARKVFTITDRPVYRPNQSVKYKLWIRNAQYDQEDVSQYANKNFTLRIYNPKNEKILVQTTTTDAYGGIDGELALPNDATLGTYRIQINGIGGQGTFRVEEYKKPEFEVTIESPEKPVMLGDKITAKVKATYYFGAPVTDAKVKIKITRSKHSSSWYPVQPWDWFYGNGYWWFGYDYNWYPGWNKWGCLRPIGWWWPNRHQPPEVIAETEQRIGKDGTISIEIDTAMAKAMHGDEDHAYTITAEVTDKSRRTIVGKGKVLVAREPFKIYAWSDRGHYRTSDTIQASFSAHTLDNKPITGNGTATLYRISYKTSVASDSEHKKGRAQLSEQASASFSERENLQPTEQIVQQWNLSTDTEGNAKLQINAAKPGQYRIAYSLTDSKSNHTREGAHIFVVMGKANANAENFRFNAIELIPEKREYANGETVKLRINTEQPNSTVVLFLRPSNGIYLKPQILHLDGKSTIAEIPITKKDMPNFFVEAFTISNGKLHTDTREIVVPPEKRILNIEISPSAKTYKPGEPAKIKLRLTDLNGKPFIGSTVLSIYDKSVEYISGGSNIPEIKAFFWKWRRHHNPKTESNLDRLFNNLVLPKKDPMRSIGVFGHLVADEELSFGGAVREKHMVKSMGMSRGNIMLASAAPMAMDSISSISEAAPSIDNDTPRSDSAASIPPPQANPTIRTKFADTAFWAASLTTDSDGYIEVEFDIPENLTTWKIKAWAMGHGTKVGEGSTEIITSKDLLLRLQAPRFFVEKDIVVLSANVHNYLKTTKEIKVILELDGQALEPIDSLTQTVTIDSHGEKRIDWRVRAMREGEAIIRMKALTNEESDAMQMSFPVYVHGMLKTESFSGVIRPEGKTASIILTVPRERRIEQTSLEIRYSPTLAGAMVDALPYLVSYPYGCTEQTLNRFLPTVITQRILQDSGIELEKIRKKQTNLNAQEIGDDKQRAEQWKHWKSDPVFDEDEVAKMVKEGINRLTSMQNSDGGWGWFSGYNEHSYPHTTATIVHGLQIAATALPPCSVGSMSQNSELQRTRDAGLKWLRNYQSKQVARLTKRITDDHPRKSHADNLDAMVFMVLTDADIANNKMLNFLYRDRTKLSVYAKSMFGIALHRLEKAEELSMIMRNIEQYLKVDNENQTAYLNLQNGGYWWYWYGSEFEAHAYYLKLLAATDPKSEKAAGLVKYLLNNRKHATYWNSTRDTALCIEALADYLRASGEDKPDMQLEIFVDGERKKSVTINADNLFSFDNKLILKGQALTSGEHTVELRRTGTGPVYFNAYLTNFTLEDHIKKAGLEIKVERKIYKLTRDDKNIKVSGSRGQALDQRVERYKREILADYSILKSGDLIEIELEIESKNDYEYILFEDMKAAGFEAVNLRSGYIPNDIGAYVEFRDERVAFLVRKLARGKHSVSYRLRAEIPGTFSALPTRASAMYAPELKANSDEIKLTITD